uniref:hypothetical protein n=1 Tax=Streptomyces clavuligerus TaxID=1901 RepID=UPI0018D083E9
DRQETGALLHPWADLQPAGRRAADPGALARHDTPEASRTAEEPQHRDAPDLTSLGYTSPGSAG